MLVLAHSVGARGAIPEVWWMRTHVDRSLYCRRKNPTLQATVIDLLLLCVLSNHQDRCYLRAHGHVTLVDTSAAFLSTTKLPTSENASTISAEVVAHESAANLTTVLKVCSQVRYWCLQVSLLGSRGKSPAVLLKTPVRKACLISRGV